MTTLLFQRTQYITGVAMKERGFFNTVGIHPEARKITKNQLLWGRRGTEMAATLERLTMKGVEHMNHATRGTGIKLVK